MDGFNTQPPEGGWETKFHSRTDTQRFNTQPPEGGWIQLYEWICFSFVFQHTAARRRLAMTLDMMPITRSFQHTAARRRLEQQRRKDAPSFSVSTHSRPKAAGARKI